MSAGLRVISVLTLVGVITPNRVRELHGVDEPRPARRGVASSKHELRVGQLRGSDSQSIRDAARAIRRSQLASPA